MKKLIKSSVLLGLLAIQIQAKSETVDIKSFIDNPLLTKYSIKPLEAIQDGSLFAIKGKVKRTVRAQNGETKTVDETVQFYMTEDKKSVIFGTAYNSNGEKIVIPVNMAQYENDAAFKIGKGKEKFYVWTDPECPFCVRFSDSLTPEILDKATIYFYMFPLSFHKHAEDMAMYALSQKSDGEKFHTLHAAVKDKKNKEYEKAAYTNNQRDMLKNLIQKQMKIGEELGVKGTPSLFDSKGNSVNWPSLATIIEKK